MIPQNVTVVAGTTYTLHCNSCTACCRWGAVILQPNDRAEDYETETMDEFTVLKRHADGKTCWYLDEEKGCTIYGNRPTVCRSFDCRLYGLQKTWSWIADRDREVISAGQKRLRLAADGLNL